jgi:hypothetical protein
MVWDLVKHRCDAQLKRAQGQLYLYLATLRLPIYVSNME